MLQNLRRAPYIIYNLGGKVKFPKKFKGTIVEKWADYWRNLFIDYRQMLQDLRSDIQDEPRKALIWSTAMATMYYLAKYNPSEVDFKDNLKSVSNNMVMVSETCRNPHSLEHLCYLDTCYNEGVIHYKSFGIASVMYTSELNDSCDLYKARCSYLRPTYLSYPSKIVDVGFMGRWWNIYMKTANFDVHI